MNRKLYRIFLFLAAITMLTVVANAQQAPYYTNFMFNQLPYNPGYAGSKQAICATALFHQQWQGYTAAGAPVTQFVNAHAPIAQKHGVGAGVVYDNIGYENTLTLHFYYNYKFKVGTDGMLAAGPGLGAVQKNIDGTKLSPETAGDPNVPVKSASAYVPDASFGIYYTNRSFYNVFAGASGNNILEGELNYTTPSGSINYKLKRHYYVIAGGAYEFSPAIKLVPGILYKTDLNKGQVDVNADVVYNNKLRGGLTYRTSDAISVLAGYKFSDNFHLGYSYDITTSDLNKVSNGTHELVLNYCFKMKTKVKQEKRGIRLTPRYM